MENNISVRKLRLVIVNEDKDKINEQYKFIRDSQYSQYQALNLGMSFLASAFFEGGRDLKSEEYLEAKKSLTNSNPIFKGIKYGTGVDTLSLVTQKIKKDFSTSVKNGLGRGERSVTNYKRTFPLMTRGRDLKFQYKDKDCNEVLIKWVNKIVFKVVLPQRKNELELQDMLHKIINEEYKLSQSSLYLDKNNHIMLNLTYNTPVIQKPTFIEGRTLGVDLGIKYPAYVCLSDNPYKRSHIGDALELVKQREQFKFRRRRIQQQLINVKGGQGRKEKLKHLNNLSNLERNFAHTYNHSISKRVIDFAKKHQCEYINIEKLNKDGFQSQILQSWGYHELEEMIKYKSKKIGIKVRTVDPSYTSLTCSRCGNIDKENRTQQEKFECTKCGFKLNADHNAAINIARSTKYKI